ncbi:MAG TPA: single-stranded DNA-binding protein [Roseiflexaceae bacterium]|nr:single-stranded DNA-binding protein [Roseiflexaceae bacterium]
MPVVRGTLNRVELIGWLGDAPEQRVFASGSTVCNFTIATKRMGARNENGERQIETDWTPIEVWEKLADLCTSSLHKGSRVRVSGSLRTQSWEDRDSGQRRYKTFVRADEVMFLDARQPGEAEAQPNEDEEEVPF